MENEDNPMMPIEQNDVYRENYEMRKQITEMKDSFSEIVTILCCIGGPLNDNVLNYNNKQLVPLFRIYEIAKEYEIHDAD